MPPSTPAILTGSCACNSIIWQSTSIPTTLDFCYCHPCQQITGSPFGAWLSITRSSLTWTGTTTTPKTISISDIATRSHCPGCGSTLTIQYHCYPDKTHVAAGTVVTGAEVLPKMDCHLFVSRKPGWYEIPADTVRRWEEFPDDFMQVFEEWQATGAKAL